MTRLTGGRDGGTGGAGTRAVMLEDPDIIQKSAWLDSDWWEASAEEVAPSISQGDGREEYMRRRINNVPELLLGG